ncbi:hypothetical protein [Ferrimonas senticii]|uniref:hypothetical protein n=1 Tax=Ferrimonas senticii TaxID=394566 RepID=UPI00041FA147|nr:hypothetical protein [Ferrimonas senticii]
MTGYIVFLLLLVEFMRKTPRFTFVFWLLALLTAPLWADNLEGWFRWAKTVSVLLPTALIVGFARLAYLYSQDNNALYRFFRRDWVLWALYGVLFLNIAEATLKDLVTANYFNFVAGVILLITMPFPKYKNGQRQYWLIGKDKPNDLLFYSTAAWNFLYTTWNMAFVYGENASYFASSFCILMAAELYPLIKKRPELYIIARVYTLACHILIRALGDPFVHVMDSSSWANNTVLWVWGAINMVLHIAYLWWYFKKGRKPDGSFEPPTDGREPPLIKDCQLPTTKPAAA